VIESKFRLSLCLRRIEKPSFFWFFNGLVNNMATIIDSNIFSLNDMRDGITDAWIAEKDPDGRADIIKSHIGNGSVLVTILNAVTTVRPHKFKWVDEGLLFRQAYKYDIASGGTAYMLVRVGTKYPHVLMKGICDGDLKIEFFALPTVTADGDEEPTGNFNFNSEHTSLTTWFPNPTISDDGSYIGMTWILGGSGLGTPAGSEGAGTMSDFDIILVPNVEFIVKFTNHAGRDMQLLYECVYTEWENDFS